MKSTKIITLAGIWLIASAFLEHFYNFVSDGLILLSGCIIFAGLGILSQIKAEEEVKKQ